MTGDQITTAAELEAVMSVRLVDVISAAWNLAIAETRLRLLSDDPTYPQLLRAEAQRHMRQCERRLLETINDFGRPDQPKTATGTSGERPEATERPGRVDPCEAGGGTPGGRSIGLAAEQPQLVKPSREDVARALYVASGYYLPGGWDSDTFQTQDHYLKLADAALALLDQQPTEAKVRAQALDLVRADLRAEALVRSYETGTFTANEVFALAARFTPEWVEQVRADRESEGGAS